MVWLDNGDALPVVRRLTAPRALSAQELELLASMLSVHDGVTGHGWRWNGERLSKEDEVAIVGAEA